jgi:alpha-beta hydrolase superfamily lysophospholipase
MAKSNSSWENDIALEGFEMRRLQFPADEQGEVMATLVRRKASASSQKAVLYIHGYMDYFFQSHLADAYITQGFNFYAVDLRKYGRSLKAGQLPNYCKDIREYFAEISEALRIIREEDKNTYIVLNGHSTGGLISSLYAATGAERQHIKALILNSPFFRFNFNVTIKAIVSGIALVTPPSHAILTPKDPSPYIMSIHKDYHGEWDFSFDWRKLSSFPIFSGWVRAIHKAQDEVANGLDIQCPVLVLHSDKSIYGLKYTPDFQTGDAVLSVQHIKEGSKHLGRRVQLIEIKDGLHDLVLSRKDVREKTLHQMFAWLESLEEKVREHVT